METAPLTEAYVKAREASFDGTSHDVAAAEFAKAKQGIEDPEALRILSLLEQNHLQLSQIVKQGLNPAVGGEPSSDGQSFGLLQPASTKSDTTLATTPESTDDRVGHHADSEQSHGKSRENAPSPALAESSSYKAPRLPSPSVGRKPAAESTTSLAVNLATARGIRTKQHQQHQRYPQSTSTSSPAEKTATNQPTGLKVSRTAARESTLSQADVHDVLQREKSGSPGRDERPKPVIQDPKFSGFASSGSPTDDAFQKFYSTFEGLLAKLSAPLAFTGLPLSPEDKKDDTSSVPAAKASSKETTGGTFSANNDTGPAQANVEQVFSKAALRALRDQNGSNPRFGAGNIHESFYVVPPEGGTMSYATILSRDKSRPRASVTSLGDKDEDGEHGDEFEDAPESPQAPKAVAGQKNITNRVQQHPTTQSGKTLEELELENESLKDLATNLSNRLYMWEKSSQSQSMALQQSIRTLNPPPTAQNHASDSERVEPSTSSKDERIKELEEKLRILERESEKYGRENEKLKTVVMRYRERWEKLKEGAAKRREKVPEGEKSDNGA